jgi:hypothetical protein
VLRDLPAGEPGDAELLADVGRHPGGGDLLRQECHQLVDLRAAVSAHDGAPAAEDVHARDQALGLGPKDDGAGPGRAVRLERRAAHGPGVVARVDLAFQRRLRDALVDPQHEVAAAEHDEDDHDHAQEAHVRPQGVAHGGRLRRRPPGRGRGWTGRRRVGGGCRRGGAVLVVVELVLGLQILLA